MSNVKTLTKDEHNVYKLIDPRVHFNIERNYYTSQGCTNVNVLQYQATNYSDSTLNFIVTTAGPQSCVHKKCYITYSIQLFDDSINTGVFPAANSVAPISDQNEGIRPYALTASTATLSVSINGQQNSWNPAEAIIKMAAFNNQNFVMAESGFPVMLPQFMANSGDGSIDFVRSENAGYESQTAPQNMMSNNIFNFGANAFNPVPNVSSFEVEFTCVEPVICSPFEFGGDESPALYGVNKIVIGYDGIKPARFWSSQMYNHGANPALNRYFRNMKPLPSGLFTVVPTLSVLFLTPPSFIPVAPLISYPIFETVIYRTQLGTLNPNGTSIVTSSVVPLKCIPSKVYIWCGQSLTQQQTVGALPNSQQPYGAGIDSCAFNEACAAIKSINITMGNKTGILSNADTYSLYQISRKNGCSLSFTQWTGGAYAGSSLFNTANLALVERPGFGSILCLTPEDMGLAENVSSGCMDTTQLIVNLTIFNQSVQGDPQTGTVNPGDRQSESHDYVLYVVLVNDGIATVNTRDFTWTKTIAPISKTQSVNAPIVANNSKWKYFKNMFGGGLSGKIDFRNMFK